MGAEDEQATRRLLRARDAIDRSYAQPLDIAALAKVAIVSEAHFIRSFKATFGETPHRYLQRRRIERAMALLRTSELTIGEICVEVGMASTATFTRTFKDIVGATPSQFRVRAAAPHPSVPTCFQKTWTRPSHLAPPPSSFGQAGPASRP